MGQSSLTREEQFNKLMQIQKTSLGLDISKISDGYHTFGELYDCRNQLWITLCRVANGNFNVPVWRSRVHADGSSYPGWFLLGMYAEPGRQMTFHLPDAFWNDCDFAMDVERHQLPVFDGHSTRDVIQRLKQL